MGSPPKVDALLHLLSDERLGWQSLMDYFRKWQWPKGYANPGGLAPYGKSGAVRELARATASEQISMAAVLRHVTIHQNTWRARDRDQREKARELLDIVKNMYGLIMKESVTLPDRWRAGNRGTR